MDKEEENITTGAIIIPFTELFMKKVINPNEFQLYNDNTWQDFQNLIVKVKLDKSSFVLITYNLSLPGMKSHIVSRLEVNTVPIFVINNLTCRKADQ